MRKWGRFGGVAALYAVLLLAACDAPSASENSIFKGEPVPTPTQSAPNQGATGSEGIFPADTATQTPTQGPVIAGGPTTGGFGACEPGFVDCGTSAVPMCVDVWSNNAHCSDCRRSCPSSMDCRLGECWCRDRARMCYEPNSVTGVLELQCVDISTNSSHCGDCDIFCSGGQICVSGECTCPAAMPHFCGGVCTNVFTDRNNCGQCGHVLPAGQSCIDGMAVCADPNFAACASGCVNTNTDPNNCGFCGNRCLAGQTCCNGFCATMQTDPFNCGFCGRTCALGQTCVSGACTPPPTTCTPTSTTDIPCNGLDDDCNGTIDEIPCTGGRTCQQGACQCPGGQTFCNGVCVNIAADPLNCGACSTVCAANRVCTSGVCQCQPGFGNCNTTSSPDCETDIRTNANCGACGNACTGGMVCTTTAAGVSSCQCPSGLTNCSGVCRNLASDSSNCGTCGIACATGQTCINGVCTPPPAPDGGTLPPPVVFADPACGTLGPEILVDPSFESSPDTIPSFQGPQTNNRGRWLLENTNHNAAAVTDKSPGAAADGLAAVKVSNPQVDNTALGKYSVQTKQVLPRNAFTVGRIYCTQFCWRGAKTTSDGGVTSVNNGFSAQVVREESPHDNIRAIDVAAADVVSTWSCRGQSFTYNADVCAAVPAPAPGQPDTCSLRFAFQTGSTTDVFWFDRVSVREGLAR